MRDDRSGGPDRPGQDDPRTRIVTAVLELSAEAGVPALSLAKILERAGTGHRTFHRHFAGVDEAVAATYEDRANAVIEALLETGLSAKSWEAGFRAALRWIV